jgi:RNA polymerase sigma-70 factor (ECF subfamily)
MRPTGNSTIEIAERPSPEPQAASVISATSMAAPSDIELLRRIGHGDQDAFRELVNRHSRYLYGIAFSLTGNSSDAEDVVQETFIAVINSKFRGESAVRTWLVQILIRRAAMLRRSKKRSTTSLEGAKDASAVSARGSGGSDAKLDLAVMLEALSIEHRQVIVLRELEGMSYEEMAIALDVPRGTVESRLHRARNELRERFKGYLQKP